MQLIDRHIIRSYFKAYAVCFISLVSLYIVIDLFTNLDEFCENARGVSAMLKTMGVFYFYRLVLIFDRLTGPIVLLAAMFTMAWMQRNNEILPLLSAGVSTRRLLRPVLLGTLAMLGANLASREFVMPQFADRLENPAEDPLGEGIRPVTGAYEPNGILVTGRVARLQDQAVLSFTCTLPEKLAGGLYHVTAKQAHYIPKSDDPLSGGWLLTDAAPAELPGWKQPVLQVLGKGKFFLYTEKVDFEFITRDRTWYQFASTPALFMEMQKTDTTRLTDMSVRLHGRFTQPVVIFIMVVMGLSILLKDQNRNVFISSGLCLLLAGVFFAVGYFCRYLGDSEYLSPVLAAWLPVLLFGPPAVVMFDAIHT